MCRFLTRGCLLAKLSFKSFVSSPVSINLAGGRFVESTDHPAAANLIPRIHPLIEGFSPAVVTKANHASCIAPLFRYSSGVELPQFSGARRTRAAARPRAKHPSSQSVGGSRQRQEVESWLPLSLKLTFPLIPKRQWRTGEWPVCQLIHESRLSPTAVF